MFSHAIRLRSGRHGAGGRNAGVFIDHPPVVGASSNPEAGLPEGSARANSIQAWTSRSGNPFDPGAPLATAAGASSASAPSLAHRGS